MKSKQLVLIGIALLCGLVSAIGIIQAMGGSGEVATEIPHGPVVVASAHLDHTAELNEENVKVESWPVNLIPEGAATEIAQVQGKFIQIRLRERQAIIIDDVTVSRQALAIPPDHKVINIKVPPEDLLGGLLKPGHRVDIIGVFNKRDGRQQKSETKTFLKGIRIFNIGGSTSAQESKNSGSASGIVGVLVTEKQSEKIVWARKNGEIRLALIGDSAEPVEDPEFDMGNDVEEKVAMPTRDPGFDLSFAAPQKPKFDRSKLRQVKVYHSDKVKTTWFDEAGNEVVPPGGNSTSNGGGSDSRNISNGASESPSVDYEEPADSAEIPNGIEEDQYRGE